MREDPDAAGAPAREKEVSVHRYERCFLTVGGLAMNRAAPLVASVVSLVSVTLVAVGLGAGAGCQTRRADTLDGAVTTTGATLELTPHVIVVPTIIVPYTLTPPPLATPPPANQSVSQ
jgi:hypothetical protein